MDWQQLAAQTIAVLIPLTPYAVKAGEAVASKIGESVIPGAKKLYELVQNRFMKESHETVKVFDHFVEDPKKYSGRLENVLLDLIEQDPDFATQLQRELQSQSAVQLIAIGRSFIESNEIKLKGNAQIGILSQDESAVKGNTIIVDN
ncbi:MAG: hypothetical protein U0350_08325 [Caldilineaceae bacterium]